ncbi:hypothetical protein [Leptospira licerasiae]|uniref:hypothetical protein n=1 Tax=Leptospira licerasiae TaxID=447106 RepID=UPI000248B381|nr:hypothetical protein [Leptospira licerasiae]EIE02159.1 hypothetical protein LEP1GSC185_1822 [Leptospira licerasiae serovar Varillal str. VAR 010]
MFVTLFQPTRNKSFALVKYLFRLVRKDVRPILILPKGSLGLEDGLSFGRMISKISNDHTSAVLGFAENFSQAVHFCKEIRSGSLGHAGRELPIFVDATRLTLGSESEDLEEAILGLGENWSRIFPLTCFIEIGRDSSRLEEASGRTSLFRISSLVMERKGKGWRSLKSEKKDEDPYGDWTYELISDLLPDRGV